jgi:hypothetical protein
MKLDQTLEYLGLEELPKAGTSTSQKKMACLVERVTGVKDYAIAKNGGIVADIGFQSSVKRIIEFYPEVAKKDKDAKAEPELTKIDPPKVELTSTDLVDSLNSLEEKEIPSVIIPIENIEREDELENKELTQQEQDVKDLEEIFPTSPEQEINLSSLSAVTDLFPEEPLIDPQPVSPRSLMIAFLETQRNKRATLDTKTDDQLSEMCKRFGKEF